MDLQIEQQNPAGWSHTPSPDELKSWVAATLAAVEYERSRAELAVRLVSADESATLNQRFRDRAGPTNILSFPAQVPESVDLPLLGDLVVCVDLVETEAKAQNKPVQHHLCHLVVHGILHLLGHDHQGDEEAARMEAMEIDVLQGMGIANPYVQAG